MNRDIDITGNELFFFYYAMLYEKSKTFKLCYRNQVLSCDL